MSIGDLQSTIIIESTATHSVHPLLAIEFPVSLSSLPFSLSLGMCFRFSEFVFCFVNFKRTYMYFVHDEHRMWIGMQLTFICIWSYIRFNSLRPLFSFLSISFLLFYSRYFFLYKLTIHVCVRIEIMWTQSEASPEVWAHYGATS